jgi:hypothetical protein
MATTLVVCFLLLFCLNHPAFGQANNQIFGQVFNDLNTNGTLDYHEPILPEIVVCLYQNNILIQEKKTAADGNYTFINLNDATYQIKVSLGADWANVNNKPVLIDFIDNHYRLMNLPVYQTVILPPKLGPIMIISNISHQILSTTSIKINWFTNQPATSQVIYDSDSRSDNLLDLAKQNLGYRQAGGLNFEPMTYHTVIIDNLTPGVKYFFRAVSLPNPRQWYGSMLQFSPEVGLTLPLNANKLSGLQLSPENNDFTARKTVHEEKNNYKQATNYALNIAQPELLPKIVTKQPTSTQKAAVEESCQILIWILLLANILAVLIARNFSGRINRLSHRRVWWVLLIFIIIPFILGKAECWLIGWLIITFLVTVSYLAGFKKLPEEITKKKLNSTNYYLYGIINL